MQLTIIDNSWFGQTIDDFSGQVINSGGGLISNNILYAKYGNEVGLVKNGLVKVNIEGYEFKLTK